MKIKTEVSNIKRFYADDLFGLGGEELVEGLAKVGQEDLFAIEMNYVMDSTITYIF